MYLQLSISKTTNTAMVCNKVIVPNKVIFSLFVVFHQNQIILENLGILNDTYIVKYCSKSKKFQELFDFDKKS